MRSYIPYFLSIFLYLSVPAQIRYDSIHKKIQRIPDPRKKVEVYLNETARERLSIEDYERITHDLEKLGNELHLQSYAIAILSSIYHMHEDFDKCMFHGIKALELAQRSGDTIAAGFSCMKIANCFHEDENYEKTREYFHLSAGYYKKMPVSHSYNRLKDVYNSLGSIFKDSNMYDSALYYHNKTLDLAITTRDKRQQAYSYNNIGLVYNRLQQLDKAIEFYEKSAALKKELGDRSSLCGTLINKANVLEKMGKDQEAAQNFEEGINMARETGKSTFMLTGMRDYAILQVKLKKFKEAALLYQKYERLQDSVNRQKEKKKLEEIAAKYESQKKDAEILKGREDIKIQQAIIEKQKQFNYAIGAGLILAFISIAVVLRSYYQNKRFSRDLTAQKTLVDEKNKEITDSINYAQRIQESLFTSGKLFEENASQYLILFKPKDIVSGDFYWAHKSNDGFIIMCGDCTGHGVPGAFMSLLGMSYLTEIVTQNNVHQPNLIFNELRHRIVTNLNQKDEARKDGMDASLIKVNGLKLEFACSNNPIWIIRDRKIIKFKADKFPIGMGAGEELSFTHQTFDLNKGDTVFMFTDGYADQFGGPQGKKFKVRQLEEKMIEIDHLSLNEQRSILQKHFYDWKGGLDQVDDVLVIAIRV